MTIRKYSERALEILNRNPIPSVWGRGEKPIYDRLPAISEGYKKSRDFGQEGMVVEGCQPLYDRETGGITVKSGSLSWREGSTFLPEYLLEIPLKSGRWFVAAEIVLDEENVNLQSKYYNWESVLGDPIEYISTGYVKNPSEFAFMVEEEGRYWLPSESGLADWEYLGVNFGSGGAELTGVRAYGSGTALITLGEGEISVPNKEGLWEINFQDNEPREEMRLYFHSGDAKVEKVLIEGVAYYPKRVLGTGISEYTLGLSVYQLGVLSDPTKRLCPIASLTVEKDGNITNFRDIRKFTPVTNEPVAEWITEAFDFHLLEMFSDVKEYREKWMDSLSACKHLYEREITSVDVI